MPDHHPDIPEDRKAICALADRGLWNVEDDDYDEAVKVYEDFCLGGYPYHALTCPSCDGEKTYSDEWWDDGDCGYYEIPCERCKGRGVISVDDETEMEREIRTEVEREARRPREPWKAVPAGYDPVNKMYRSWLISENGRGWDYESLVFTAPTLEEAIARADRIADERNATPPVAGS